MTALTGCVIVVLIVLIFEVGWRVKVGAEESLEVGQRQSRSFVRFTVSRTTLREAEIRPL